MSGTILIITGLIEIGLCLALMRRHVDMEVAAVRRRRRRLWRKDDL